MSNSSYIESPSRRIPRPLGRAEAAQGAQLAVAELDAGVADHAGVEAQHVADGLLGLDAGVEAHGEVVARVVPHLVHAGRLGQREHAPVRDPPDHPALLQDQLAGGQDDSVCRVSMCGWLVEGSDR